MASHYSVLLFNGSRRNTWSVRRQRHGVTLPPFLISSAEGEVFFTLSIVTLESATILQQVTGITFPRYTKFIKEATLQNAGSFLVFFFLPSPLTYESPLERRSDGLSSRWSVSQSCLGLFGEKGRGWVGGRLRKVTEWEEMCRT